jgi:AraC family transcriptional regulator
MVDLSSEIAEIKVPALTIHSGELATSQQRTALQPSASLAADQLRSKKARMTSKFMAPWQQRGVEAYIAANLHTSIRMADLAQVAQCAPWRFHRSFKRSFGCTPHQYVIRRRIARSQRLMTISNESLVQISAKCGFVDQFHLRNMFRRIVGQPPGAWRRIHNCPDRTGFPFAATQRSAKHSILFISESPSVLV